jgi:hypothetical protein
MLENLDQRPFDWDSAVLAALATNMDDGPIVATAKVTDVGAQQFIGAQSRQQCGEDKGAVAFDPVAAPPRLRVRIEGRQERGHRICRQRLRQRLRELGPADQRHRVSRNQLRGV